MRDKVMNIHRPPTYERHDYEYWPMRGMVLTTEGPPIYERHECDYCF